MTHHPTYHTPYVAIVVYACVVATLAISSSFTQLAILANVAALTLYLMCVAASIELQRRDIRADGTPFAVPGGPAIPIAAAIVILWLLSNATRREFLVEAAVLAAASILYPIRTRGAGAEADTSPSAGPCRCHDLRPPRRPIAASKISTAAVDAVRRSVSNRAGPADLLAEQRAEELCFIAIDDDAVPPHRDECSMARSSHATSS